MKKTKIKYEDIKAGDLIQTVESAFGVKWELTGIAYEKIEHGEDSTWQTSQGGDLVGSLEDVAIYRIDVREVQFDDIKTGDKLRVTTKTGNITTIVEDVVTARIDESINPYWVGPGAHFVVFKYPGDAEQTIEIVERGAE